MDTETKSPSLVAEILKSRQKAAEEPREALKDNRQAIPTPMLDVNLASGEIVSFSYAYLTEMVFIPGDTLTLTFGETKVIIDGQNLRDVRDKIRLHKADGVQEGTEAEGDVKADDAPHISRIEIERGEEERKEKHHETGRHKGRER